MLEQKNLKTTTQHLFPQAAIIDWTIEWNQRPLYETKTPSCDHNRDSLGLSSIILVGVHMLCPPESPYSWPFGIWLERVFEKVMQTLFSVGFLRFCPERNKVISHPNQLKPPSSPILHWKLPLKHIEKVNTELLLNSKDLILTRQITTLNAKKGSRPNAKGIP